MTERFDVDSLPPVQYLIMEVLAARWRLGERMWPFPTNVRAALMRLERVGLVGYKSGIVEGTFNVWLTDYGRDSATSSTYRPPDADLGATR